MVVPGGAEQRRSTTLVMLPAMARRGPDAEGFHTFPTAAFSHRRLATINISPAGSRPMLGPGGRYGLVFQCDPEVLPAGLITWPLERLLAKLRGMMFSFAFWDQQERTAGDGWLAFSSSATSLRVAGLMHVIDPYAVLDFLEFGHTTQDPCIWKNAGKLPPGTLLRWRDGKTAGPQRYWTSPEPDYSIPAMPTRFKAAVEEVESLFLEATRLRLIADVKVGALLSAGINSKLVCWALRRLNTNSQLGPVHEIVELSSASRQPQRTQESLMKGF